jgi:hypothetical protein
MTDIYSLYTQNGVPVANKIFERVIFKHGLKVSPVDLIDFQDSIIRDFNNFLFATRGQLNGVYKTEYDTETTELTAGLSVSLQEAETLTPSSNYELKINRGKAYIGGKLVIVPLNDYVEVPDNDIYSDPETLHLILERTEIPFEPTAIGEPGFAIVDGQHTSDRYEAGYTLRLVKDIPTDTDENGNILFMELASLFRPTILKQQNEINLNQMDGVNDKGINWTKYESNLHILNVDKVDYLYGGITVSKIPSTITQAKWDSLNDSEISTTLVAGVYYVPYTKNILIVHSDVATFSQERIWFMPHTAGMELTDKRFIMEDLPTVIDAAFQAVADILEHKTNFFEGYVPYGLDDEFTPGSLGIQDDTINYNPDGKVFWTLPIATDEPIIVYRAGSVVNSSLYTVIDVIDREYTENGELITKEMGKIEFTIAPPAGERLTVDFYHDAHTLYTENTKHEAHINDIDAHPLYINNAEMSSHLANNDIYNTCPNVEDGIGLGLDFIAHDNRYFTKSEIQNDYSVIDHNHDDTYSQLGHEHPISEIDTLQDQLVKIEDNMGVYNKTTRLIMEKIEEGIDGLKDQFIVDSVLMQDETVKLVGVRADLTGDSINNPVILNILRDPSNITGIVDSRINNTIEDIYANFPNDLSGDIRIGLNTYTILSNTENSITLNETITDSVIGEKYIIDPHTITGKGNNYIEDSSANFPTDDRWIGGNIQVLDNSNTWHTFIITSISNIEHKITVEIKDENIGDCVEIGGIYLVNDFTEGGINPWTEPQKVSFGGNNLGLVVSAVQTDNEVWSLWVDTMDGGSSHTLWWATRKEDEDVWSPPINTGFNVDSDCRPSIVLLPNDSNPLNEDLLWLFSDGHNIQRSYVTYGQTNYTDPELFYGIANDIYSAKGIYINRGGVGIADEIWLVYDREDNGYMGIFLRRFHTNQPYGGATAYDMIGSEIKLSSNDKNCYFPTITQESAANGNIWIAWIEDNSVFDNRKQPLLTLLDIDAVEVVAPNYIPTDITEIEILSNFNNDSKMELHYSADNNVWLVYSILDGGFFKVYYTLLEYELSTNSVINLTPPVELNWGHEVSITERSSDGTIWINYNQATQVYSQVRILGNGEVKWIRSTGDLITERAPNVDTFIELRWQLPFVNLESRLEYVESELRTHYQKLQELEGRIKEYNEGTPTYVNDNQWTLPAVYNVDKASDLRIFVNGLRLRSNIDWSLVDSTITFVDSTIVTSKVIVEWNQLL